MASFSSLHIGVSALSTSQRAVEVAAHNVANAATEGFTRQRLNVQTAVPTTGTLGLRGDGQRGMGVTVIGVERLRDRLSDATWRHQSSLSAAATARSSVLDRVEQVVGVYGESGSEALSRFFAAWDQLSLTPADPAARNGVLAAGAGLADGLRATVAGLDQVRGELGQRMADTANELNGLLEHVAKLNLTIRDAEIDLGSPNDLRDSRDKALDRIATLTGGTVGVRADGMVTVSVGGTVLVDGGTSSRVTVDAAAEPPVVEPGEGLLGTLGGLLATAVVDLPLRRAQLDEVAVALRDAVNAVHSAGTGVSGSSGQDFYAGEGARDLRLADGLTEATVAAGRSGAAGDGTGALAMSRLRTDAVLGTSTLPQAFRSFTAVVGQAAADAQRSASTAKVGLEGATFTRASLNGVNVDEEMVDLMKYQHAYSAASRVITVIDEMLDRVINQMGR